MSRIKELVENITEEARRQKCELEEYRRIIHELLEQTVRVGKVNDKEKAWQMTFRWFTDKCGTNKISFSSRVSRRGEQIISADYETIDSAINYMYKKGCLDNFIERLCKEYLPLFLNNMYPDYYLIG